MNVIESVSKFAPGAATVDELWSREERAASLERILLTSDSPAQRSRPRRRRLVLGLSVAAAVAAAAVVVPLVLPSGHSGGASPAAAAELDRLAAITATAPWDQAGPTQFVHMVVREVQVAKQSGTSVLESWTAKDGSGWRRDTRSG